MSSLEYFEFLSYVVTIFGFPFAIWVFLYEKRKERENDNEELYQRLSDEYAAFLKLILENADLQLMRRDKLLINLNDEQRERKRVIFELLTSLFERAFILVYEEEMSKQARRLWQSWEDYMREWCKRDDFRSMLPQLLEGEDEDFQSHIRSIAIAVEKSLKASP